MHGFETIACECADLADGMQAQIAQFALLHVAPYVFDRIEFRCIGRQALDHDVPVQRFDMLCDHTTAVSRQPIPDHQQFAADLRRQRLECKRRQEGAVF